MIVLTELEIDNFLSFGPTQRLRLAGLGLVFVEGENRDDPLASSNGSGKSGLPEALTWCLTGKTSRGLRGDDVIHNLVDRDCSVIVRGEKDAEWWSVHRYRKINGRKSGVSFFVNDEELSTPDQSETQKKIDSYLGVDYDIFTNAVVFGQGDKWRFTELGDSARKALLDKLLGIECLARARDIVAKKLDVLKRERGVLEVAHRDQQTKVEADTRALSDLLSTYQEGQEQRVLGIKKAIVMILGEMTALERSATTVPDKAELESVERELAGLNSRVTSLKKQMASKKSDLDMVRVSVATVGRDVAVSEGELAKLANADALGSGHCPLCGSDLKAKQVSTHRAEIRSRLDAESSRLAEATKRSKDLSAEIKVLEGKTEGVLHAVAKLEARRMDLRESLARADGQQSTVKAYEAEIKRKKKEIITIRAESEPRLAERLRHRIDSAAGTIRDLESAIGGLDDEASYLVFWIEGFGNAGIKSHLLDYVVPLMTKRAAKFSRGIMGGLAIEFSSQTRLKKGGQMRDKLDVLVTNDHGAKGYDGSSGGEKRKIDIVVARTLQSLEADRSTFSWNLAWWDEVFESLDESSCEAVVSLLREEAKSRGSMFVISHLDWLRSYFPKVLRVVKEGGYSRLEWAT